MTSINQPWVSIADVEQEHEGSTIELWFPADNAVCKRIIGHFHVGFASVLMDRFDQIMERGERVLVFHDWGDTTGFDSEVKKEFTSWAVTRSSEIEQVYVYAVSTFLRLAIKVSNLATGNRMTVYASRDELRETATSWFSSPVKQSSAG